MELRFWMKYVACAAQPDAGKTLKMQVTLLPPLGFVDDVLALAMAGAVVPAEAKGSTLEDILKPNVAAAWAAPRVSPLIVIVTAEVPVATPAVVRTIEVLVAVAAVEDVACSIVTEPTVLVMEVTIPRK
jgi:hypothetical protein